MDSANYDLSMLENFSTPMLENLIRMDLESDIDQAVVLRALEILQQRAEAQGEQIDVDAAWQRFQEYYLPLVDSPPLFEEEEAPLPEARPRKRWKRIVGIAAVLAVLVAILSATAAAGRYDRWKTNIIEHKGHFSLTTQISPEQEPQELDTMYSLHSLLDSFLVDERLIPTWFPDGFEATGVNGMTSPESTTLIATCTDGNRELFLEYSYLSLDPVAPVYEMDDGSMQSYESNGRTYNIYTNSGIYCAIWHDADDTFDYPSDITTNYSGLVRCSVFGCESLEEIQAIIDSIPA